MQDLEEASSGAAVLWFQRKPASMNCLRLTSSSGMVIQKRLSGETTSERIIHMTNVPTLSCVKILILQRTFIHNDADL